MNQTSFEVGDRVRHKVTQIEGEIMHTEESLAMPHASVIEPSEREVNPPRACYALFNLAKLEAWNEKHTQVMLVTKSGDWLLLI